MRGRFEYEPLYLDLGWARDEPNLTLDSPRFKTAVAHVAAPIRNMGIAKGKNETITYISLKSGLVVRATEDANQSMNVIVAI